METGNDKLRRGLGPLDATMMVIGSMIGSGIFITSAESTRLLGAPGWLLLAWTMAGLLTIAGALCCAELAGHAPARGRRICFPCARPMDRQSVFFLAGRFFSSSKPERLPAVAIAFAKFAGVFVPGIANEHYLVRPIHLFGGYAISLSTEQLVAVLLILLLTWLNTRGLETGKLVQKLLYPRQDRGRPRPDCRRLVVRLECPLRGAIDGLVESVGQWLEPASGRARPNDHWILRSPRHLWKSDGRAASLPRQPGPTLPLPPGKPATRRGRCRELS